MPINLNEEEAIELQQPLLPAITPENESLEDKDLLELKQSLPPAFQDECIHDDEIPACAYPLLSMLCKNQKLVATFRDSLDIDAPAQLTEQALSTHTIALCDKLISLETNCQHDALFKYRLPIVIGEFPIHTRVINTAIKSFNQIIEQYHQDISQPIDAHALEKSYEAILTAIKEHGPQCDADSLWQLLSMLAGWSKQSAKQLFEEYPFLIYPPSSHIIRDSLVNAQPINIEQDRPIVIESTQPANTTSKHHFLQNYNYNFNRAGRLATETDTLLLNAFGMKIGGHFDAQVKYPPRFIPVSQLHAIIHRQLSHRMEVTTDIDFDVWIENTLVSLGVERVQQNQADFTSEKFINPFLSEPISFLNPEKIRDILEQNLRPLQSEQLNPSEFELGIISQYLFELLHGFQVNPGQGLGIGANWDGTINLSNEAGAYSFKFMESEASWGKRFKQISLHRQGPSEVFMSAGKGINYEVASLLTDFNYMSQLQPSEHGELIYSAIVDNLVAELFPEPAYFENKNYKKYQKQHIVRRTEHGDFYIDSFYQPSHTGTYFKDKNGIEKQTPMYKRAGTLDVQAFPKNTGCCENSRESYAGNPLGPLQLQYAQSMQKITRGHFVYDPIAADQFLPDAFYGQLMLNENGDYLPFIGVVPKNFDKHFKQPTELCASFVIRMMQSSRMMEYCPTFRNTYEKIKTQFLPALENEAPALPELSLNKHIKDKHAQLAHELKKEDRNFADCQKLFYGLFKNLIYSVYEYGAQSQGNNFTSWFFQLTTSTELFYPISKATCERIIRDLTVNRPITAHPDKLKQYETTLNYLRTLTQFFYPLPTDEIARAIASQAKAHIKPLLRSNNIKLYFNEMQQSQQNNLSRRQTPGMAYAAFKHGGPSKTIVNDYHTMHTSNFLSGYRDPEGNQLAEPQLYERAIDFAAKALGASLQLMQKYNLLAVIRRPLTQPYIQAKKLVYTHPKNKPLWAVAGAVKGFFWNGIAIGLWQTITTPFKMLRDFAKWITPSFKKANTTDTNPLAISAAPANEASIKVKATIESRDHILQLLSTAQRNTPDLSKWKKEIVQNASQWVHVLYPQLTQEEKAACNKKLTQTFPVREEEWSHLVNPFIVLFDNAELLKHTQHINHDFTHAFFQSVSDPSCSSHPKKVIKYMVSFHKLNSKQQEALTAFVKYFNKLTDASQKQSFAKLFQFGGKAQQALRVKDKYLQKIQSWTTDVFDPEWLRNILFEKNIESLTAQLTPQSFHATIKQLPDCIKEPLYELLHGHELAVLDHYYLNENQKLFLKTSYMVFRQIHDKKIGDELRQLCKIEKKTNEKILGTKDKSHNKWAKFAERELTHQLFSKDESRGIFSTLSTLLKNLPNLTNKLDMLKMRYQVVGHTKETNDDNALNEFYLTASCIQTALDRIIKNHKTTHPSYIEAQIMLRNFVDVTMNAIVNSRLDRIDVFSANLAILENSLAKSEVIESWLNQVKNNQRDLTTLLEQQTQQSPSLDHALWRNKCILQVLEKNKPQERIHKTGIQSLLRFWCQHKTNVTKAGDDYMNPNTCQPRKVSTTAALFSGSSTMQYAIDRVEKKLPARAMLRKLT